jgi:hypothetical protein
MGYMILSQQQQQKNFIDACMTFPKVSNMQGMSLETFVLKSNYKIAGQITGW